MLFLLLSTALAAPTLVRDEVLAEPGRGLHHGRLLSSADGALRVVDWTAGPPFSPTLYLPEDSRWRALPMPVGAPVEGLEDVEWVSLDEGSVGRWALARDWAEVPLGWEHGGWAHPLDVRPDGTLQGARHVDGTMTWLGHGFARPLPEHVHSLRALEDDQAAWFDEDGVRWLQRRSSRTVSGAGVKRAAIALTDARPVVAWAEEDAVVLSDGNRGWRTHRLSEPQGPWPSEERCAEEPREARVVEHSFAGRGVATDGEAVFAAYERLELVGLRACHPPRVFHPCDPVDDASDCARPRWECDWDFERRPSQHLVRVADGRAARWDVGELLGWEDRGRVLDLQPDGRGGLHLLIAEPAEVGERLRLVQLAWDARPPAPPRPVEVEAPAPASMTPFALGRAGWRQGTNAQLGLPSFADGAVSTGGAHGPGWWTRTLPPGVARAAVEVEVTSSGDDPGCGRPELSVSVDHAARLELSPTTLTLQDVRARRAPVTAPLAPGPHRVRLEVDGGTARVSVDGTPTLELAALAPASGPSGGSATFGLRESCGVGNPTVGATWTAVRSSDAVD